MSESFWKKASIVVGLLAIGVLFGMLVMTAHVEIRDFDLWLHLGVGQYILEQGYVPDQDVLSCTITGHPWINHEWLFQVIAYTIYHNWGAQGLIWMQIGVIWLMVLFLLFLGYSRDRQILVIFSLLLVVLNYQARFTVRPEMFSLLFFTVYIYVLSIYIDRPWSVLVLFFVQVLWSNFHGFFFFGPLFVLIALFSEWLKRYVKLPYEWNKIGRLTNDEYGRLKRILIFVVLACLVNPQTFKGAWYPIGVFLDINSGSRIFFNYIQELAKPIHWNDIFAYNQFIFYKIMILISFYTFVFNRRKIDVSVLIFWLIFLGFSLIALRNVIFFAFAAYLVIITNSLSLNWKDIVPIRFTHDKFLHISGIVLKILLIIWMMDFAITKSSVAYFDFDKFEYKSATEGVSQTQYPVKAVKFLADNEIKGNMFNDFNTGAYLVGHVFPNLKVFIDGRTEVYGPKFFNLYLQIWRDANMELFDKIAQERNITVVLLSAALDPIPKDFFNHLQNSKDWALVYFDYDAAIYFRDVPEHRDEIEKFRIDLAEWKTPEMDLQELGPQRVAPYRYINRAFSFESIGLYNQAYDEAAVALRINPAYVGPYKILGKVYASRQEYERAFENFRIAAMFEPGDRENRYNLAQAYYDIGDLAGSAKIYNSLIAMDPNKPKAYFLIARVYAKDKKFEESLRSLQSAVKLAPDNVPEVIDIGEYAADAGEWQAALAMYQLGVGSVRNQAKLHNKIGLAHKSLGDNEKAREAFQKALELEPQNEEFARNLKKTEEKISR